MKTRLFLLGLSLCLMDGYSQTHEWCGSNQVKNQYYKENPQHYQQVKAEKNRLLSEAREAHKRYELGFQSSKSHYKQAAGDDEYRIPVVFHIMHQEGSENISYEQVLDQLRIMNEDFARLNTDAIDTPAPFVSRQDSVELSLIADPVSAYAGQNSFITFQSGTDLETTNGTGERYTYYITTDESPDAPNFEAYLPSEEEVNYAGALNMEDSLSIAFGTITEINGNELGNRVGIIEALADELNSTGKFEAIEVIIGEKELSTVEIQSASLDILSQQEAYLSVYNGANHASSFYFTKTGTIQAPTTAPGDLYEVNIEGLTSKEEIATALQLVIDGLDDFEASVDGSVLTISNTLEGSANDVSPSSLLNASISKEVITQGVIIDNEPTTANGYGARLIVNNLHDGAANQRVIGLTDMAEVSEIMKGGFIAASTKISFELAKIDPDGNCTSGINRMYTRKTLEARDQIKSLVQWDPYRYLNIWVVETIENLAGNGITLGYAQFPEDLASRPETDGLVIRHDYLGSTGTASSQIGRTASHEIGHWLGLRHIWGDDDYDPEAEEFLTPPFSSDDIDQICSSDDGVNDTPLQGDRSSGCASFPVASECHDLWYGDMYMNYMDYSNDICMNLFTKGQEAVMVQTLETIRTQLWSEENLIATGLNSFNEANCAPHIVAITSDDRWICEGSTVDFEAEVYYENGSSNYLWTFEGANTTSSTEKTPSVSYDTPGVYEATVSVSNGNNTSIKTRKQMIHVISENPLLTSPLTEGFAQWQFPDIEGKPFLLSHRGEENIGQWEYIGSVNGNMSPEQAGAIRARTKDFNSDEPRYIAFPNIDLSDISGPIYLEFEYAHAPQSTLCDDHLDVKLLGGCDANTSSSPLGGGPSEELTKNLSYAEGNMTTNGGNYVFFDYIPEPEHWQQARMKFNLGNVFKSNTTLYFELHGNMGEGNYIYIDNVTIGTGLDIEENNLLTSFSISPNPSNGDALITLALEKETDVKIRCFNILGENVGVYTKVLSASKHYIPIKEVCKQQHLDSGIYFIECQTGTESITEKIIISK